MQKTILITGATDGIGLEAAKLLAAAGHHVLLHGRNPAKLATAVEAVQGGEGRGAQCVADLSRMSEVESLADVVAHEHDRLDVAPVPGLPGPPIRMPRPRVPVDHVPLRQDFHVLARVPLLRGHELNGAVQMFGVVPGHEPSRPPACVLQRFEGLARILGPVLHGAEEGLRVRVVVAHTRPAE